MTTTDYLAEVKATYENLPRCESCGDFATGTIHNPHGERKYACGACSGPDFLGFSGQPPLGYIRPLSRAVVALEEVLGWCADKNNGSTPEERRVIDQCAEDVRSAIATALRRKSD